MKKLEFKKVKIGNQIWMAETLNIDHYRNGDIIPQITAAEEWNHLTKGAWCYYDNDPENGEKYGKLYNCYAVDDARGLAPVGWHIPSVSELCTLVDYLGGETVAGGKMKEVGTTHWQSPNTGATNESGFTALAGGHCNVSQKFMEIGLCALFWIYPDYSKMLSHGTFSLSNEDSAIHASVWVAQRGASVRCIMD